jgi:3-deoxy-D-manno-octulosonic-acid transferase
VRRLYTLLIRVATPFAFAQVLWRGLRDRRYWEGLSERFGCGPQVPGNATTTWVHAVSLGEMTAAVPLIRALQRQDPAAPLVLTCATPTGRARAQVLFGERATVRYLPYDSPGNLRRFLRRVRPRRLVILETELWPNLFAACAQARVPVILASARLSERSVARYRRAGSLFRALFAGDVTVGAQSEADAARFRAIGADPARTHVVGNVKFDIDVDAAAVGAGQVLRTALLGARPVWIAGSTHAGEEETVLAAHARVRERLPGALLVLVPRHPQRFEAVAALLAAEAIPFARRTQRRAVAATEPVLLVDTTGELLAFYAAADVAFVGGSLVAIGGHNLLEPAALGMPVLTGPSDANGREIAALLTAAGAVLRVGDAATLAATVERLLADPAERERIGGLGRAVVAANRGSVARVLALLGCV